MNITKHSIFLLGVALALLAIAAFAVLNHKFASDAKTNDKKIAQLLALDFFQKLAIEKAQLQAAAAEYASSQTLADFLRNHASAKFLQEMQNDDAIGAIDFWAILDENGKALFQSNTTENKQKLFEQAFAHMQNEQTFTDFMATSTDVWLTVGQKTQTATAENMQSAIVVLQKKIDKRFTMEKAPYALGEPKIYMRDDKDAPPQILRAFATKQPTAFATHNTVGKLVIHLPITNSAGEKIAILAVEHPQLFLDNYNNYLLLRYLLFGLLLGVFCISYFMFARKLVATKQITDQTVRTTQKQLNELFANQCEGIVVIDSQLKIGFFNAAFAKMFATEIKPSIALEEVLPAKLFSKVLEQVSRMNFAQHDVEPAVAQFESDNNTHMFVKITKRLAKNPETCEYFIAFRDITAETHAQELDKINLATLTFLSKTSAKLLHLDAPEHILTFIGTSLAEFLQTSIVVVDRTDELHQNTIVHGVFGAERSIFERGKNILHYDPVGKITPITELQVRNMQKGTLSKFNTLAEFAGEFVPEPICAAIAQLLNIRAVYSIGLLKDQVIHGGVHIISQQILDDKICSTIETYINIAAAAYEKRIAEQQLRASYEKIAEKDQLLAAIIDNFDGYVYMNTADYKIQFMNAKLIAELHADLSGEKCYKAIFDLEQPCSNCMISKVLEQKVVCYETHVAKNNSCFASVSSRVVREDGTAMKLTMLTDITERKAAEDALRASQKLMRHILDLSLDMIIATNAERNIVEFNLAAQRVFGYLPHEVLGKHVSILYADNVEGNNVYTETKHKRAVVKKILNKRKDGTVFPALLSAAVMVDTAGNNIGIVGFSRDISSNNDITIA